MYRYFGAAAHMTYESPRRTKEKSGALDDVAFSSTIQIRLDLAFGFCHLHGTDAIAEQSEQHVDATKSDHKLTARFMAR